MTKQETSETFEAGTVVDILPDRDGCNFLNGHGWVVVGPTRHAYAVVVREPEYGTTMHINVSRLARCVAVETLKELAR